MKLFINRVLQYRQVVERVERAVAAAALFAGLFAVGCTTVDDTLGANLVPDNQQMKAGYTVLQWHGKGDAKQYVKTRLYQTDSIVTSNLSTGYVGTMFNDTVGLRTAGLLAQFTNYYLVDEGYFGYEPIFDSVQMLLSITGYGRDTLTEQTFEVYEVTENAYLTEKPLSEGATTRDSTFYMSFDPEEVSYLAGDKQRIIGEKPLFTFKLGTENGGAGPSTTAVTMDPTPEGKAFIKRLMLQEGDHKDDYAIYDRDNVAGWFDIFKGFYIKPAAETEESVKGSVNSKGTIYAIDLTASGFSVYGRNRVEAHPELIQDTIGMVYCFKDTDLTDCGNVSINRIRHDYTGSPWIDENNVRAYNGVDDPNDDRPYVSQLYVEGLGGVVTEIEFTQDFFKDLQQLIVDENNESGKDFRTLAFTQVQMEVYFPDGQYDWQQIKPSEAGPLIDRMNAAPERLGMYTHYWRKMYIADYNYTYESYYNTTLPYGGYINRSHGCYRMDITAHVQQLWNAYIEARDASDDGTVDLKKLALNKVYLGPAATDFFTSAYTELQGQADPAGEIGKANGAPIRFILAYNLVK